MSLFHRSFPSELFHVKSVMAEALGIIKMHFLQMPEEDEYDLRLILSELLLNAVIHGNRGDRKKTVSVTLDIKGDVVYCVISDEGDGFDHCALLAGFAEAANCEAVHGRGVRIACALTDTLQFNVVGNTILFRKRVSCDA